MTPNAPARGSLRICSLRSRSACEHTASATSHRPSRWMPPFTKTGRHVKTAAAMGVGRQSQLAAKAQASMARPSTTPTKGNPASAAPSRQSTASRSRAGTRMRENVANEATTASLAFTSTPLSRYPRPL